jgi:hypothetical protein
LYFSQDILDKIRAYIERELESFKGIVSSYYDKLRENERNDKFEEIKNYMTGKPYLRIVNDLVIVEFFNCDSPIFSDLLVVDDNGNKHRFFFDSDSGCLHHEGKTLPCYYVCNYTNGITEMSFYL